MKKINVGYFYHRLYNQKAHFPLEGQIELTYRCNFNCIHCYCKGSEVRSQRSEVRELTTEEWKEILDVLQEEGCLNLCFSGGDPLIREDFLEIYSYAKNKGFIITIFTNGLGLTAKIIDYLAKSPPFSMEITLNGITQKTYESVTQIPGSFPKAIRIIKILKEKKIPLVLKTNCLKQNSDEVGRIKEFSEELLGKPSKNKHYFKYDPMIYPRLNGDKAPCNYRLSFEELLEVKRQDSDFWDEYQKGLHSDFPELTRERAFLYWCNSWLSQFFINPFGRLKFCMFSHKFSVDLRKTPFRQGFYEVFPKLLDERFKTNSKCRDCDLRIICTWCPARAYLETGDEEAPVEYYCDTAKKMAKLWQLYQESAIAGQPLSPAKR